MYENFFGTLGSSWMGNDEKLYRSMVEFEKWFVYGIEPAGQLLMNRSDRLFRLLPSIEDFVWTAIAGGASLSSAQAAETDCQMNISDKLVAHSHSIGRYLNLFPTEYYFSEAVMLLEHAVKELGPKVMQSDEDDAGPIFNQLVEKVVEAASHSDFQKRKRARERRSESMFAKSKDLIDKLLFEKKKIQVVQVDLGYAIDISADIQLPEAKSDFSKFLNLMRSRRVLSSNIGYLWTAGYATYRGFYFRMFIFFDDDIGYGTAALSHYVEDFWKSTITSGKGIAFPSDERVNPIMYAATGQIDLNDNLRYRNLMLAMRYLAIKEMHITIRNRDSMRVFGHSKF